MKETKLKGNNKQQKLKLKISIIKPLANLTDITDKKDKTDTSDKTDTIDKIDTSDKTYTTDKTDKTDIIDNTSTISTISTIFDKISKIDQIDHIDQLDNNTILVIQKILTPTPVVSLSTDDVNITIKSCKNISAKQALLIIPITKFFTKRHTLNKLIGILKGESISLRLIDWFVTNYCKKYNIMYNLNLYRPIDTLSTLKNNAFDNFIIIHNNYKGQLKAYSKKNFDPFCRRNRIRFYYEDNKYFITTVGQLNFFKWALENYIINYIQDHISLINDDMNLRCEIVKKKQTKLKSTNQQQDHQQDHQQDQSHNNTIIGALGLELGALAELNSTSTSTGTNSRHPYPDDILLNTDILVNSDGHIANINNKQNMLIYDKHRKPGTRKKRNEISQLASKSMSIHNYPTTLIFD